MSKSLWTLAAESALYEYTSGGSTNVYGAFEVTLNSWALKEKRTGRRDIIDYVTVYGLDNDAESVIRCYEIKATKSDLLSKNKLSFVGDYNYLVVHPDIAEIAKKEFPEHIGILTASPRTICSYRKTKRVPRQIDIKILRQCMFRSMSRDAGKLADLRHYMRFLEGEQQ